MDKKHEWKEEIEIATGELISKVKELLKAGNIRRLIIKDMNDRVIVEIPLNAGIAIGGAVTLMSPLIAILGALAGVIARVKIEIIRVENSED
jgi:hypothetical protein